ncbi:MAG: hypothetical protein D3910_03280 [Candidatus Electrothrix sp. ATG2]|nr:hypothetical protein [Candidatus Electrothrix sp. ATG2]
MSSILAGLSDRLLGRLFRAAEGPVIAFLFLPLMFFLPDLGDRHQLREALHIFLLAGGAIIAIFSALFHLLIRHEESSDHRFRLLASVLLAMGVLFFFFSIPFLRRN